MKKKTDRINTKRFDRLWAAVEAALGRSDYDRCLRILRIISDHGRPRIEGYLAEHNAKYVRELRDAMGKEPPATGMSHQRLDQFDGGDINPLDALIERQERLSCYRQHRRKIMALLAQGDCQRAQEELHSLSASEIDGAVQWAMKKLQELGGNQ